MRVGVDGGQAGAALLWGEGHGAALLFWCGWATVGVVGRAWGLGKRGWRWGDRAGATGGGGSWRPTPLLTSPWKGGGIELGRRSEFGGGGVSLGALG